MRLSIATQNPNCDYAEGYNAECCDAERYCAACCDAEYCNAFFLSVVF